MFGTNAPAAGGTPAGNGAGATAPGSAAPAAPGADLTLPPVSTGAPAISGSPLVGQTLAGSIGSWIDSPTSYAYQWEDCDTLGLLCTAVSGATSSSYTLAGSDVGDTIRVVVTATNAGGSTPATSAQTATVTSPPAPSNSGVPVVSGSAQQGDVLTTSNGSWSGSPTSYAYQWQDCNGSGASCSGISGATSSSYTLAAGDVGHTVRSVVTATNAGGSTPADSAVSGVVAASGGSGGSPPTDTVQPYFAASTANATTGACSAGCAIEGQQLSVTPGVWSNSPTSYSYQWQDCTTTAGTSTGVDVGSGDSYLMNPPTTGSCTNISGATSNSYTIQSSDVGHALVVNVTATNGHGSTTTSPSGSCDTGLMTTTYNSSASLSNPAVSTYFDNGEPGCSPISAVVGTAQYGSSTAGEHFCTNAPITCGFADIANAGVPVGTSLYAVPGTCTSPSGPGAGCANTGSGWSYSGGVITLTSGAVLQNVRFVEGSGENAISIGSLSNITIQDDDISAACGCQFQSADGLITVTGSGSNITIQNNNLHGLDASTAGDGCLNAIRGGSGTGSNVVVDGNNIWFCGADLNGIEGDGTWTIDENYIHDMAWSDAAKSNHFDGLQLENGGSSTTPLYYANNTMLMDSVANAAGPVILSDDFGPPDYNSNRHINHNLLAGGAWSLYVTGDSSDPTIDSTFENNVFSQIYLGDHNTNSSLGAGNFGPDIGWTSSTNTWSGNIWDDTGSALTPVNGGP